MCMYGGGLVINNLQELMCRKTTNQTTEEKIEKYGKKVRKITVCEDGTK